MIRYSNLILCEIVTRAKDSFGNETDDLIVVVVIINAIFFPRQDNLTNVHSILYLTNTVLKYVS